MVVEYVRLDDMVHDPLYHFGENLTNTVVKKDTS